MMMEHHPCPYLNHDDLRCTKRLTLVNLPQAFTFCLNAYACCAVYQQLRREQDEREEHAYEYAESA